MKIYCKLISIVFILGLFSCERVQSLEGLVVDVHNVPLDSVLISDNLMNFRMRTDSLGRFRYMIMLPTTSLIRQNEMYCFCKTKCDYFLQNEMY